MREIVNGIFYVMRAGCALRLMPSDLDSAERRVANSATLYSCCRSCRTGLLQPTQCVLEDENAHGGRETTHARFTGPGGLQAYLANQGSDAAPTLHGDQGQ
jgi:hypothetical protein